MKKHDVARAIEDDVARSIDWADIVRAAQSMDWGKSNRAETAKMISESLRRLAIVKGAK